MLTKTKTEEAKRVIAASTFSSTEVDKWDLLLKVYLKRDEAEWVESFTGKAYINNIIWVCNMPRAKCSGQKYTYKFW